MFKKAQSFRRPVLVTLALLCTGVYGFGQDLKVLPGHVPKIVSSLTPFQSLPSTNQLRMAIGLPLHNTDALQAFMTQLYDPASPGYRHFLTQEEFNARFGPTADDYEAVKNFARTNGLTVASESANRLLLDVTAPASAVESAFHIKLHLYHHPTEARDFYAPDTEPTVDAALPIVDVQGLSDLPRPHPRFVRRTSPAAKPKSGTAPDKSGDYFGSDFRNAYASGVALTGTGQSVGLFEADGYYSADISTYANASSNGSSGISVSTVLVGISKAKVYSSGGNLECSLDIEMAMSMAPGLSQILVFEGNPNAFLPNNILNSMLSYSSTVKNLSSSWGWNDGPSSTTDTIFTNMAAVGQSYFNASGDSCAFTAGSSSANGVDNPSLDNAPSSSPIITQVGATTLDMNGGSSYITEEVWNWGVELGSQYDGEGSSGGVSSYYSIPPYQAGVSDLISAGGSTSLRNIPDVAANGDNVSVYYGSGKIEDGIGGTSCAAPLWAGFFALVNQQAAANGLASIGFANPALYSIGNGANYNSCFHDVTTGNNTWSGSPSLFYAQTGYDLCTGFGSPNGTALINALAGGQSLIVSPASDAASGVGGGPFAFSSGTFQLTNTTASQLKWSLINTSSWLGFSATNGTLSAGGATSVSITLAASAYSLPVGSYTANLIFSNSTANTVVPATFTLQVNQPLSVSPAKGFSSAGQVGGPFNVTSQVYSLTNLSGSPLSWTLLGSASWLTISTSGGVLPAGGATNLVVSLSASADSLALGVYTNELAVTNAYGLAAGLPFLLSVGQTIVTNGGFETGSFAGWTLNASTEDDFVTPTASFVHSGSYGASLGQPDSLGSLSQSLLTTPGQNYVLSFWLDNPTNSQGGTPNEFEVEWNGNIIFNQSNIPFMGWTNLQFIVSASGSSTLLQFNFYDTPAYLGLDDVSVQAVVPPVFKSVQSPATNTAFNLTWSTVPGLYYQVQYITNLAQTNWVNLGAPVLASTNTLSYSDSGAFSASPSRFYRIILAP